MSKILAITLDDLRSFNPCSESWRYATRMFVDTANLGDMLRKILSEKTGDKSSQMMAVDWGFWAMRLWMGDSQIAANIRGMAKHLLKCTAKYTSSTDENAHTAIPLAIKLFESKGTDFDLAERTRLLADYEVDARRPPVYYALGLDLGVDISNIALAVIPYAGSDREKLLEHFENLLLAFADHDHTQPFVFGDVHDDN